MLVSELAGGTFRRDFFEVTQISHTHSLSHGGCFDELFYRYSPVRNFYLPWSSVRSVCIVLNYWMCFNELCLLNSP